MDRVLLKISGEALKNNKEGIIDFNYIEELCKKIHGLIKNYHIGIVVGGGNIWRGRQNTNINEDLSDKIGILSTTINSLILNSIFDKLNIKSIVLNSFEAKDIVDKSEKEKIETAIKENKIIIFGGGTGYTRCSTDTAAAMRAVEMESNLLIKLTNVDGVYNKDPKMFDNAVKYDKITYDQFIEKELKVMDIESIKICKENKIKVMVMDIKNIDNINTKNKTIIE